MAGVKIVTGIDELLGLVNKKGRVTFSDASKQLDVEVKRIERWAEILESKGLIMIDFPITGEPSLLRKRKKKSKKEAGEVE